MRASIQLKMQPGEKLEMINSGEKRKRSEESQREKEKRGPRDSVWLTENQNLVKHVQIGYHNCSLGQRCHDVMNLLLWLTTGFQLLMVFFVLIGLQVELANILEIIVDTPKVRTEVSCLFLKPVSRKEAPDNLKIIKHPMHLSTIKEKVRKLE
ncbi:hypothetical protein Vadar_006970 [Vaccinium darrowii]|uniref:Uncharacterized protein n=1 Tax=Vaccinium darrowii TaxID=229202 RepID=A0ACB7Y6Y6_9ERIC|nr:hypothetical protein Vadar_006970 [Vaccinium darrowii]